MPRIQMTKRMVTKWLSFLNLVFDFGGPDDRHFETASLERTLEDEGLEIRRSVTIPGVLPMAYVESVVEDVNPGE